MNRWYLPVALTRDRYSIAVTLYSSSQSTAWEGFQYPTRTEPENELICRVRRSQEPIICGPDTSTTPEPNEDPRPCRRRSQKKKHPICSRETEYERRSAPQT